MAVKGSDTFVKLKNPYTFGVPVRGEGKFFGREEELRLIFDTLENVPRGQKQDMVVLGPRRIGKSSLLYRLFDSLTSHRDFVPVYIDLQNIKPKKTSVLFRKILEEIKGGYRQKQLLTALPPFKILRSRRNIPDLEFFTLHDDLSHLNNVVAAQNLPRLVLMFDEVELLMDFGGQDTLDWFRSLIQSLLYTVFVIAGSDRLYALTQDYGSPFYNIFKSIELRPLTPEAARNLIKTPAVEIGMQIPSSEVDKILKNTGYNPYFIQAICHYLVERLNQRNRTQVYPDDIDEVVKQSIDHLSAQFAYIWEGRSQPQKVVLYSLAKGKRPQIASALITNLSHFEDLIKSRQKQQDLLANLVEQQVLKIEDGRYWFTIPLFVEWILSKLDDREIISLTTTMPTIPEDVDVTELRRTLLFTFDDSYLDSLVLDHFPVVYDKFSGGMRKEEKITLLFDYLRQSNQFDKLLILAVEYNKNQQAKRITQPTIFISYSHKDEQEKDTLLTHLGIFEANGLIDVWSDDRIGPGVDWEIEINRAIAQAKVVILLISANFLISDFILDKQIAALLEHHKHDGLVVMPVIAKACAWRMVEWLSKMQVRPKNGRPIWREGDRYVDEELAAIAAEIARIIEPSENNFVSFLRKTLSKMKSYFWTITTHV